MLKGIRSQHIAPAGALLFFTLALLRYLWTGQQFVHALAFGDETEKFVVAQMLEHGMRLYKDIFAHHGPLSFMIAHAYAHFYSASDFSDARWSMVALALFSAFCVLTSPALKTWSARWLTAGTYLALLSSIWGIQGAHMISYYPIGGLLLVVPIAQLVFPYLAGREPARWGLIASGAACVLVCFSAYSLGPSAVLICLAAAVLGKSSANGLNVRQLLPFGLAAFVTLALVLAWLGAYGDFVGFFVYHFYFNQAVYYEFVKFTMGKIGHMVFLSLQPFEVMHSLAIVLIPTSLIALLAALPRDRLKKWSMVAAAFMILSALFLTNPKSTHGFQALPFDTLTIAIFGLSAGILIQSDRLAGRVWASVVTILFLIGTAATFEAASFTALSSPHGATKTNLRKMKSFLRPAPEFDLIQRLSKEDGDVMALISDNEFYIRSERLPASGNIFYLPWQAAYYKHPILGYKIDICKDISEKKPSIIKFRRWMVWDMYDIANYEPCVVDFIKKNYVPLGPDPTLLIRADHPFLQESASAPKP